jgi:diguanylate cyclase (GGDEF)-like protein/PAS domain S-box-containing protein
MGSDLYEALVDALEQGVIVVDAAEHIEVWNYWMSKVSGISAEKAVGKKLKEVVPELVEGAAHRAVRRALERGNSSFLSSALHPGQLPFYQFTAPDGSGSIKTIQQSIQIRPVSSHGAERRCLLQIRDVSRVVQMEDHLRQMSRLVDDQRIELEAQQAEVERKASFDPTTGLANRSRLRELLAQALPEDGTEAEGGAILVLDLNHFKTVNESFGHEHGDGILRSVARRISEAVRPGDLVARLGSDEFAVLLPGIGAEPALAWARRITEYLARPHLLDEQEVFLSASCGIAIYPDDGPQADLLLRSAERALHRARELGPSACELYRRAVDDPSSDMLSLTGSLHRAVDRQEFRLFYQPLVGLPSQRLSGVEALLRWHHPHRGFISPAEFVPLLEDNGLILQVGAWVLETACKQAQAWLEKGLDPGKVAVNVSPRQFRDEGFAATVKNVLEATKLPPERLELEITETLLMKDQEQSQRMLAELKAMGVHVAIDDFGTGYSSLGRLKRYPIDTLKIDRTFTSEIGANEDDNAICTTIIGLGHLLGMSVTAEGVETEEQLRFLAAHGCDCIQGYFFAKPMPADQLVEWYRARYSLPATG